MQQWDIVPCRLFDCNFMLLNKSGTQIYLSERTKLDIVDLMTKMEEYDIPLAYTGKLDSIHFTTFSRTKCGDYLNNVIRLNRSPIFRDVLHITLLHEIAHHVDSYEGISEREDIALEKTKCARFLSDTYARHDVLEYVAVGFEVFYFGTKEQHKKMKRLNPKLYNTIKKLHKKYYNS